MPTDPRWIEHTEKAAWETVQSLRLELERERKRLDRLTRLQPAWSRIASLLDELRNEHSIDAPDEAEALARTAVLLREATRERDELKRALEEKTRSAVIEHALGSDANEPASMNLRLSPSVRRFARLLERKRRQSLDPARAARPRDVRRLLAALELKVEELAHARPDEVLELAVDVGHLALLLMRRARRRPSKLR
jgi:hypothetical protein